MRLMGCLSPAGKVPPDVQRPASPLHSDLIDLVPDYVNCDAPPAALVRDPFDMRESLVSPAVSDVSFCHRTFQLHAAGTVPAEAE